MEEVIVRFLSGDLSETEKQDFEIWLNKNPENKKLFEDFKKLWNNSGNLYSIESIDVNNDWEKTSQRMDFGRKEPVRYLAIKRKRTQFWQVAATIIILLGIGVLSKQYLFTTPEMIRIETTELKKEITLPDGSMVFLNRNSELEYPEKFNKKQRLVNLSGEGYFDVFKNQNSKFRINIDEQAVVEVLGTSFNINSTKKNGFVEVNVLSGKVAFYTPETKHAATILTKDDNALLQNGIISKNIPKDKNFLSWRTGVLFFEDEKIEEVCKTLTQFYDRKIISEGLEEKDIRFTSTIDNQKLESVLKEIKLVLNLDYTISQEKIVIYKSE